MFSKSHLLKTALVAAAVVISNPLIADADDKNKPDKPNDNGCQQSGGQPKKCQAVPAPAMLPALMLLGGGAMLYKRRKQSSQVVLDEKSA